ncbi:MAG: serine/threonine-protein phosphatase [Bacteroidales bacterium]|nr:serine/threonine-protein phosphatase [Bacteroidales bacterium]
MERSSNTNIVRLYKEKMNMLLEVVQLINEDNTVEELMSQFETLLKDAIGVGKMLVYTRTGNHWSTLLASGVTTNQIAKIDVSRDLSSIDRIENITMTDNEALVGFDAVIPLFHKYKSIGYVLVGDDEEGEGLSPTLKNLKFIQILCNLIVVFIEGKKVQEKLLKQQALKNELKLASQIQAGLIPHESQLYGSKYMKCVSMYHPHQDVGGDYYDVLKLSPYSVGFCMADVSGKGISAALLMSNFQAMLRSLFTSHIPLEKLARELNMRICHNVTSSDKFITAFIGRYNILSGQMEYINAGHLAPIVHFHDDKIVELQEGCIALGMLDFIPAIEVGSITMHKGARLVTYTDGLIELDEGEYVSRSIDSIKQILTETNDITKAMKKIEQMSDDNMKNNRVFDDVSVLGIEFLKKGIFRLH